MWKSKRSEERIIVSGGRNLEDHGHVGLELNDLATGKTKLLIVIKNRIHVLNPYRIYRAVKYNPVRLCIRSLPFYQNASIPFFVWFGISCAHSHQIYNSQKVYDRKRRTQSEKKRVKL